MGTKIRRTLMAIAIGLGVLGGVGSYTFFYAKGFSYMSNDPKACMNCHVMREHYESWEKSSHRKAAACNGCHVPHDFAGKWANKALNGWNHSKAFTLQNFLEPIRISERNLKILEQNCVDCHAGMVSDTHAAHRDLKPGKFRCTVCHDSVGHMSLN